MRNYYDILGIGINASFNDIDQAYNKLKLQSLRDTLPRNQGHYALLNIAYEVLKSPKRKYLHDLEIAEETRKHANTSKNTSTLAQTSQLHGEELLENLHHNPDLILPIWNDRQLRSRLNEWQWSELIELSPALATAIIHSETLANWSNHHLLKLAMLSHENCTTILSNPNLAPLLTGTELLKLSEKFGFAASSLMLSDPALSLKLNAKIILTQNFQRLGLVRNEEIESINEYYILAKYFLHKGKTNAAIKYFTHAVAQLHIPSFNELIALGNKADLKFCLEQCEKLHSNSLDYHTIKSAILKSLLKTIDNTSEEFPATFPEAVLKQNFHHQNILKVSHSATREQITKAYIQLQKEALRDTSERNKTYYEQSKKAFAALTVAQPKNPLEKHPLMKQLQTNPSAALELWKKNRSQLTQWQWYELMPSNQALAAEMSSSLTIAGWCNFIIFKLASLNKTNCRLVLENTAAAALLTGTELCQLADMHYEIKTIIETNADLSLKYHAAKIIQQGNYRDLNLAAGEDIEIFDTHYILGKKFLHENIPVAAIHYFKEAVKNGHVNSFYELIHLCDTEAELKFCQETCDAKIKRYSAEYRYIHQEIQKKLEKFVLDKLDIAEIKIPDGSDRHTVYASYLKDKVSQGYNRRSTFFSTKKTQKSEPEYQPPLLLVH